MAIVKVKTIRNKGNSVSKNTMLGNHVAGRKKLVFVRIRPESKEKTKTNNNKKNTQKTAN